MANTESLLQARCPSLSPGRGYLNVALYKYVINNNNLGDDGKRVVSSKTDQLLHIYSGLKCYSSLAHSFGSKLRILYTRFTLQRLSIAANVIERLLV